MTSAESSNNNERIDKSTRMWKCRLVAFTLALVMQHVAATATGLDDDTHVLINWATSQLEQV